MKLDRKRRRKYGIDETDPLNAYDLTSGEEAEEEEMEVDEALPAVAEAFSRMAHTELYGADNVAGGRDGLRRMGLSGGCLTKHRTFQRLASTGTTWR